MTGHRADQAPTTDPLREVYVWLLTEAADHSEALAGDHDNDQQPEPPADGDQARGPPDEDGT